jgi:hypothetical protein
MAKMSTPRHWQAGRGDMERAREKKDPAMAAVVLIMEYDNILNWLGQSFFVGSRETISCGVSAGQLKQGGKTVAKVNRRMKWLIFYYIHVMRRWLFIYTHDPIKEMMRKNRLPARRKNYYTRKANAISGPGAGGYLSSDVNSGHE